jgi:hypothetical protein
MENNGYIKYDAYFTQLANGSFDIMFDATPLEVTWKPNIVDMINCSLFSNKRVRNFNNHINILNNGGSVCDHVYNTNGKLHGSLIEYKSGIVGLQIAEKAIEIENAIRDVMQFYQSTAFIDEYSLSISIIDSNTLKFNLNIFISQNTYKQSFFIKYANI